MEPSKLLSKEKLEILNKIEPEYQCYFKWFLALTEIQHPTFKVKQIAESICSWCKELGVNTEMDKDYNIVVRIPENKMPSTSPVSCIQAHIDMVWVGETVNDRIYVELNNIQNKRIISAPKSTLGADDGFGVALNLELIEKRNEFVHGPMELIFTSDEEQGLIGMKKLPRKGQTDHEIKPFNFKYLINCDCLVGKVTIGSCGGVMYEMEFNPQFESGIKNQKYIEINLSNFMGGHSGATIQNGQLNPIKAMVLILKTLTKNKIDYRIFKFTGGHMVNAIPTHCFTTITVDSENKEKAINLINNAYNSLLEGYNTIEKNMKCELKDGDLNENEKLICLKDSLEFINFLTALPHGVIRFHPLFKDTVDSSINLAQVHLSPEKLWVEEFSRGITECELDKITMTVKSIYDMCSFGKSYQENLCGHPWSAKETKLSKMVFESAKKIIGEDVKMGVIAVTIEPVEFVYLGYTDIEMVSACPAIPLAHCIGEWMDVDEAIKWRKVILDVVSKLTE